MIRTYYDQSPMGSTEITPEGYLKFDAIASRSGIFLYPQPDGSILRAYRSPEEVFKADSLASFALKPIVNDHEMGRTPKITADNVKSYQIGAIGENVRRDGSYLKLTGMITDKAGVAAVQAGRRGLSLAYDSDDIDGKGITADGLEYDYRQTNIKGNHLAIVDRGRAGSSARLNMDTADVMDGGEGSGNFGHSGRPGEQGGSGGGEEKGGIDESKITGYKEKYGHSGGINLSNIVSRLKDKTPMSKTERMVLGAALGERHYQNLSDGKNINELNEAHALLGQRARVNQDSNNPSQGVRTMKYNLDGVEIDAPESVINALVRARTDGATATTALNAANVQLATTKTNLDTATATADAAKAEVAKLKAVDTEKLVQDGIAARIALVESASLICDAADLKGKTDAQIKGAVIAKVFPEMKMDGKSADYVSAMFDAALQAGDAKQRRDALAAQRKQAITVQDKAGDKEEAEENAKTMLQDAWKADCSLSAKKK